MNSGKETLETHYTVRCFPSDSIVLLMLAVNIHLSSCHHAWQSRIYVVSIDSTGYFSACKCTLGWLWEYKLGYIISCDFVSGRARNALVFKHSQRTRPFYTSVWRHRLCQDLVQFRLKKSFTLQLLHQRFTEALNPFPRAALPLFDAACLFFARTSKS